MVKKLRTQVRSFLLYVRFRFFLTIEKLSVSSPIKFNFMIYRLIAVFFFLSLANNGFAQWENLNTGINDNLTGVVFLQQNGLASAENGLYFTTNGGQGAASWARFEITNDPAAAQIYQNTKFTHCFADADYLLESGTVFACGEDTVAHRAIVMQISLPSMVWAIKYIGGPNSSLSKIGYSPFNLQYYAVGSNGLMVGFSETETAFVMPTQITDDLLSISFDQYHLIIGAAEKLWYGTLVSNQGLILDQTTTPSILNKDVKLIQEDVAFSVGNTYGIFNLGRLTTNTNYVGPLNANCLLEKNFEHFVGTDHGILKSGISRNYLEHQLSSGSAAINGLWTQLNDDAVYACGANGLILKTTGSGGATNPYVDMTANVNCFGMQSYFSAFTGSGTTVNWYANNQLIHSGTSGFYYNFPALGDYTILCTAQNAFGNVTTVAKGVHIVSRPAGNKPFSVDRNLLCKQEPIAITINNSDVNVKYVLKKEGSSDRFGTSPDGNGGTIMFYSNPLNASGDYYLTAQSIFSDCFQDFTQRFEITVEQTKADYTENLINATVGETVSFYQQAKDSQHFEWQFGPDSNIGTATIPNPEVSFQSEGETDVQLRAWSDSNCEDTIIRSGPYVYEEPAVNNDCWTLINSGDDTFSSHEVYTNVTQMTPANGGYLSCGTYNNETFASNTGKTFHLDAAGSYLTKYQKNGILRWIVYTEKESADYADHMYSCVEDHDGNIYVSGSSHGILHDNAGQSLDLNYRGYHFILKLDAKGKLLWRIQNEGYYAEKLYIDKENNLVAAGILNWASIIYKDGEPTSHMIAGGYPEETQLNRIVMKISPEGNVIWEVGAYLENTNGAFIAGIDFDDANNIYMGLSYEYNTYLYSPNNPIPDTTGLHFEHGTEMPWYASKSLLAKFNKDGVFQWKMHSHMNLDSLFHTDTTLYAIKTDGAGNTYVAGSNDCGSSESIQLIHNSDGTTIQVSKGAFYLAKVNPDGVCQWVRTASQTERGWGDQVIKVGDDIIVAGTFIDPVSPEGAEFDSSDNENYTLNMKNGDFFIATYDADGVLKRITTNGDNDGTYPPFYVMSFFKGDGDSFYAARNWGYTGISTPEYVNFGYTIPQIENVDKVNGMMMKFTEDCGISHYRRGALQTGGFASGTTAIAAVPNPTTGNVTVALDAIKSEVAVEISDVSGKRIQTLNFHNTKTILLNLQQMQSGIYFVKILSDGKTDYLKVIRK